MDTRALSSGELYNWHHIVATYKKTGSAKSEIKIYLNGVLSKQNLNARVMGDTPFPLCLGQKCVVDYFTKEYSVMDDFGESFKGLIDDASFYNKVLSPDEIRSHYKENSWYCAPFSNSGLVENPDCGDGVWQPENNEECDAGAANGTPCEIPTGFSSCSWCSSVCKLQWNSCSAGFVANNDHECPGMFIRTSIPIWSGM